MNYVEMGAVWPDDTADAIASGSSARTGEKPATSSSPSGKTRPWAPSSSGISGTKNSYSVGSIYYGDPR